MKKLQELWQHFNFFSFNHRSVLIVGGGFLILLIAILWMKSQSRAYCNENALLEHQIHKFWVEYQKFQQKNHKEIMAIKEIGVLKNDKQIAKEGKRLREKMIKITEQAIWSVDTLPAKKDKGIIKLSFLLKFSKPTLAKIMQVIYVLEQDEELFFIDEIELTKGGAGVSAKLLLKRLYIAR